MLIFFLLKGPIPLDLMPRQNGNDSSLHSRFFQRTPLIRDFLKVFAPLNSLRLHCHIRTSVQSLGLRFGATSFALLQQSVAPVIYSKSSLFISRSLLLLRYGQRSWRKKRLASSLFPFYLMDLPFISRAQSRSPATIGLYPPFSEAFTRDEQRVMRPLSHFALLSRLL